MQETDDARVDRAPWVATVVDRGFEGVVDVAENAEILAALPVRFGSDVSQESLSEVLVEIFEDEVLEVVVVGCVVDPRLQAEEVVVVSAREHLDDGLLASSWSRALVERGDHSGEGVVGELVHALTEEEIECVGAEAEVSVAQGADHLGDVDDLQDLVERSGWCAAEQMQDLVGLARAGEPALGQGSDLGGNGSHLIPFRVSRQRD